MSAELPDGNCPEPVWIDSDVGRLAGQFYEPTGPTQKAVLFLPPFAEERKCSHRPLHRAALRWAGAGLAVLRFDLYASGDSEGEDHEASWSVWRGDVRSALEWLRQRVGGPVALLGVRLGAGLAWGLDRSFGIQECVLWQPIVDGKAFLDENLKRKRIKRMVTAGAGAGAREEVASALDTGGVIDFDGFGVSSDLYRDIGALDLLSCAPPAWDRALLIQSGPSNKERPDMRALAERLSTSGTRVKLQALIDRPFWNLIGALDEPQASEPTLAWLLNEGK